MVYSKTTHERYCHPSRWAACDRRVKRNSTVADAMVQQAHEDGRLDDGAAALWRDTETKETG
jgi:hypothetical protein